MSCSLFSGEAAHLFKGLWKKGVLEQSVISISLSLTLSRFPPSSLWGDCVHSVWFDQLCLTGKGESEVERKMRAIEWEAGLSLWYSLPQRSSA